MLQRIRSRRVLLRKGNSLVTEPAELEIADGLIVGVLPVPLTSAPESAPAPELVDLGDLLITPAFVNAHTHLALAFLRGVDATQHQTNLVEDLYFHYEQKLSPDDVRAFARMGAYESLLSGVAVVWDHYYGHEAVAEALYETGLCGVVAPTLQDVAGPGMRDFDAALESTLKLHTNPRYRNAGIYAALGPHATDTVSPARMQDIAQLSLAHDLPVHMHLAQSLDELKRVFAREGCSPTALLERAGLLGCRLLLAHAIFCPDQDLARLDPSRHTLVFCPSSQLQFGFPADVTRWNAHGIPWVIATDCASSNDGMSLQKELRFALGAASLRSTGSASFTEFLSTGQLAHAERAWSERLSVSKNEQAFIDSSQLLAHAFDLPGALHPSFRAGVIEVGAQANLIAWDTDHPAFWPNHAIPRALALSDVGPAMRGLWVRGKPIGEFGTIQASVVESTAYQAAQTEANQRLKHLFAT